MEFRITELLDPVDASDIALRPRNVASKSRVQELVLRKIATQPSRERVSRKRVRMGLLAAALVALFALTAIVGASGLQAADLFGNFFGLLSQGQRNAMDEISMIRGTGLPVSVSANGTTVTLQAAIGDDRNCYLKLQFSAPEGKQLSVADTVTTAFDIVEQDYYETPDSTALLSDHQGQRLHCYHTLTWIDHVPGDNLLELVLELSLPMDSPVSFIDNEPESLTIAGLWTRTASLEYRSELEGPWVIPLGQCGGQFRDLNVSGRSVTYASGTGSTTITLDSMRMSQLGIEIAGSFTSDQASAFRDSYPAPLVVMRDRSVFGSHLYTGDENDRIYAQVDGTSCAYSVKFDAPMDLTRVDHIRIGDLVIPFAEDGTMYVDSSEYVREKYVLGTHVTLGKPDSLRSSVEIAALDDIGVQRAGVVKPADWYAAWTYAEHTADGVRLAFIDKEFRSGKLVYTITDANVVTHTSQLSTQLHAFTYDARLELDSSNEWQHLELPGCIREDGSFEEGWYLVTLDITVENDHAEMLKGEPYLFDAHRLLTLADLRYKTAGNYRCFNIDYFSAMTDPEGRKTTFRLAPGEEIRFTIGYLVRNPDFSSLRACTTTGGETSTFVDLALTEKVTSGNE